MAKKVLYTPEEARVLSVLQDRARRGQTISYSELITQAKLKFNMENTNERGLIGSLLGQVSRKEVEQGRPMISCLVVSNGTFMPGKGFFELAEILYGISINNNDAQLKFFVDEMNKTIDFWKSKK